MAGLGPEWAGLSLTMPLKEVALDVAAAASPVAAAIGAANTLVRLPDGTWRAENTDAPGMVRVLGDAGLAAEPTVTVLGGGGTARAALAAAARARRRRGDRGDPPPGGEGRAGPGRRRRSA